MTSGEQPSSTTLVDELHAADPADQPLLRVLALINPLAGRFPAARLREMMLEGVAGTPTELTFVELQPEERARDFTARAAIDGYQMVLVAGGDGTLAEAAAGLLGTDIPLGVIPAGTGNIVATNLGVPLGIKEATQAALLGTPRAYDVGRLDDGRVFLLAAGAGYDADLIRDADRELKRRFGPLAYILAIFKNLRARHARFTVELDGWQRVRLNAKTVLVCNVGRTMGSLPLAPEATTDDGWLDVVVFRFRNFFVLFLLFLKAIFGGLKNDPRVQFFRARRVRILASRPMPVQVDGDFIDRTTPIEITILPGALRVMHPAARPALDLGRLTEDALKTLQNLTGSGPQAPTPD